MHDTLKRKAWIGVFIISGLFWVGVGFAAYLVWLGYQ
ncbi:YmiA family putative membrane protein [Salmonella enterica]|nr:YmiA family putative membrane protein [Salmonella enterica]